MMPRPVLTAIRFSSLSFLVTIFLYCTASAQWTPVNNGLDGGTILTMERYNNSIFAGTYNSGIYRSNDNGLTWKNINAGLPKAPWINIIKVHNSKLYAGDYFKGLYVFNEVSESWTYISGLPNSQIFALTSVGTDLIVGTAEGVFVERNNQWSNASSGLPSNKMVSAMTSIGSSLVVIVENSSRVFWSNDVGANWSEASGVPAGGGRSLTNDGVNFYLMGTNSIFKSIDGGKNWFSHSPHESGTVMLYEPDMQFKGAFGVSRSTDGGVTWTSSSSDGLNNAAVYSLLRNGTQLLAGTSHAVYSSEDNGHSWIFLSKGLTAQHIGKIVSNGLFLFALSSSGVMRASTADLNWTNVSPPGPALQSISDILSDGNRIYVSFLYNGIKYTDDSGNTWNEFLPIPSSNNIFSLVKKQGLFLASTSEGVRKFDASQQWIDASQGLPSNFVSAFLVKGDTTFAAVGDFGLYRLIPNSLSWTQISTTPAGQYYNALEYQNKKLVALMSPSIYHSNDLGITLTKSDVPSTTPNTFTDVLSTNDILFAAGFDGIIYSMDDGVTWRQSTGGLATLPYYQSLFASDGVIYAGSTTGVWKANIASFFPSLDGLSDTYGKPGQQISIFGKNFSSYESDCVVKFNGINATVTNAKPEQIDVIVPEEVTTGPITIRIKKHPLLTTENFAVIVTSLETSSANALYVFPTITQSDVTVQFPPTTGQPARILVRNSVGQLVQSVEANDAAQHTIGVSGFESGIYYIKVYSKERVYTGRFVKR